MRKFKQTKQDVEVKIGNSIMNDIGSQVGQEVSQKIWPRLYSALLIELAGWHWDVVNSQVITSIGGQVRDSIRLLNPTEDQRNKAWESLNEKL